MRFGLLDVLCCPECRKFPLELTVSEVGEFAYPAPVTAATCTLYCGKRGMPVNGSDRCDGCVSRDVERGFLFCDSCGRFYFIVDGIARMISEEYGDLIDFRLVEEEVEIFGGRRSELDQFLRRVESTAELSRVVRWNIDDVSFWEQDVYNDPRHAEDSRNRLARARCDAGDRAYPRNRYLFEAIRAAIPGGRLADIGCGFSQSIRVLCDPVAVKYNYIGIDLAISALRGGRAALPGDFIQASGDRLPLRENSLDAVLFLGTLHHLADYEGALRTTIDALKPGGLLGFHEVVARPGLRAAVVPPAGVRTESAHNESIDLPVALAVIEPQAEVLGLKREYSPLRYLIVRRLGEAMRSRPWLTRLVIRVDDLFLRWIGGVAILGARSALLLARKNGRAVRGADSRTSRQPSDGLSA